MIKSEADHTIFRSAGFVSLEEWETALTKNLSSNPAENRLLVDASSAAHTRTAEELRELANLIGRYVVRCAVKDPEAQLAAPIADLTAGIDAEFRTFVDEQDAIAWLREG